MKLTTSVTIELNEAEKQRLERVLAVEGKTFEEVLPLYVSAAFEEYFSMFIGRRVFTRGSDVREFRLYLLINSVFNRRLPDEQKISDLFQTTASQSKALLRAVLSKYQYDMQDAVNNTLSDLLDNPRKDENGRDFLIRPGSELLVEEMNQILAASEEDCAPLTRKAKVIGVWQLTEDSHQKLREHLDKSGRRRGAA